MNPETATRELVERLGTSQVRTDRDCLYRVSMDNLRYSRLPSACILPEDEESVAVVLELANEHRIPVTTRGAGSATTGSATPQTGGWVLDLSGWTNLHIDPVARLAYVQPGVTLGSLEKAAESHGLTYPPDPGSKAYATIGGTIATNAGGMRGAKYGVTRDYVVSLEGFLPTGEFVRWGGSVRKFSAGYNLRDLWVGSEGTLGVITGAVVKLIPRPTTRANCLAVFPGGKQALECSQDILKRGLTPSAVEFLDEQTVGCTFAFWKKREPHLIESLPECLRDGMDGATAPAALLIEVDGRPNEVKEQLEGILDCVSGHATAYSEAIETEAVENLWKLRRSCSQAMFELGSRKLNEDVVVPFESQWPLMEFVDQLHEETGLPTPTFGHAADGNFHVHIMYDDTDPAETEAASEAICRLMRRVVELRGAISGEHGIGLAKSPFFHYQHGPAEIAAMKAIKKALDPNDILNPGKLWNRSKPWKFPREDVRMPWDH
ncbi:MAG: FAD-binding oxidoreductase [Opitutales bacterium]|jgi:glycolate oxidase